MSQEKEGKTVINNRCDYAACSPHHSSASDQLKNRECWPAFLRDGQSGVFPAFYSDSSLPIPDSSAGRSSSSTRSTERRCVPGQKILPHFEQPLNWVWVLYT